MRRQQGRDPQDEFEVLSDRIDFLEKQIRRMNGSGATSIHAIDTEVYLDPQQGEIAIHWPLPEPRYFHEDKWRSFASPGWEIKVTADDGGSAVTDTFKWLVPARFDGKTLTEATAFCTTVGSGVSILDVYNLTQTRDLLANHMHIQAGQTSSYDNLVNPTLIAPDPNCVVNKKDMLQILLEVVGTSATGFGVILEFS